MSLIVQVIQNQLERISQNHLMLGNSIFLSCYEYTANVEAVWDYLPPCVHCIYNMKTDPLFISKDLKYDKCVNWNLTSQSESPKSILLICYTMVNILCRKN